MPLPKERCSALRGFPPRCSDCIKTAIAYAPDLEQRCIANCLEFCKCRDLKETYCIIQALDKAARGDVENGLIFAGSNAGRAEKIMPVAELMQELIS